MRRLFSTRLVILLLLGLMLAACSGNPTTTSWPGLTANAELAYVAGGPFLYAVDLTGDNAGKKRWQFPAAANSNIGPFSASPALGTDILVAASDGPSSAAHSGIVFGLHANDGTQAWCLALDAKAAQRLAECRQVPGASAPGFLGLSVATDDRVLDRVAVAGDTAYFGLNNGQVFAVDAISGTVKWSFQAQQGVWAAPLADPANKLVYVGSLDHNLYALDLATGAVKWKKDLGATIGAAPRQTGNTLYVGTFGHQVLALDAQTGAQKWAFDTSNWVWDTPTLDNGTLYVTDVGGTIYALNAANGAQQWSVKPGDASRAAPQVSAEAIFVTDRTGKLFALNPKTGAAIWPAQTMKGQLLGTPVVMSDTLLLAPYQGDNLLVGYSFDGAQKLAYAPGK